MCSTTPFVCRKLNCLSMLIRCGVHTLQTHNVLLRRQEPFVLKWVARDMSESEGKGGAAKPQKVPNAFHHSPMPSHNSHIYGLFGVAGIGEWCFINVMWLLWCSNARLKCYIFRISALHWSKWSSKPVAMWTYISYRPCVPICVVLCWSRVLSLFILSLSLS